MNRIRPSGGNAPASEVTTATFRSVRTRQTNPIARAALSSSPLPQGTGTDKRIVKRRTRDRFAIPHLPYGREWDRPGHDLPDIPRAFCIQYTIMREERGAVGIP